MLTKILNANQIDEAVELLKGGELVALPTETVYGLAADAHNETAILKIFEAKGRPINHPLILHIDSFEKLKDWAEYDSRQVKKLAEHFWPGPLTVVLNKRSHVNSLITGGLDTIAVRIPNHPIITDVIAKLGNGIVAPSANSYQTTSPTQPTHVLNTLDKKISAVLDGGICTVGLESTILDLTKEPPTILRFGAITKDMIEKVLKISINAPLNHHEKISGNMKNHYQPKKPLFIKSIEQIQNLTTDDTKIAVMHYSQISRQANLAYYPMSPNKEDYAQNLYHALHEIDKMLIDKIFVEKPPEATEWQDVNDRLIKASVK